MPFRLAKNVFENSEEAIVITDTANKIISVNPAFERITGFTPEDMMGKDPKAMSSGRHDSEFYRGMWDSINKTGHWHGEIWDRRKNGELYPKWLSISTINDEKGGVANYIGIFADITERKKAEERLDFMAHFDALTGLPNRILLKDRTEQSIASSRRSDTKTGILFLDLDHFKNINDSLGHRIGDMLLKDMAERLKGLLRESDTVARIGGDEFVILLPDIIGLEDAAQVGRKIMDTMKEAFAVDAHTFHTTASIGISLYPDDGEDYDALTKNADTAMYKAKEVGRNNYQFFTQEMNDRVFERLSMENNLRLAIEREEFILYYQPQADLKTGRLIGAEALIRWQHPDMGLILPARFIHIAEDSGLIVPIGEWVLRTACRQNREWQKAGLSAVPISVNLSAVQFRESDFLETVARAVKDTEIDPHSLELELTERAIMQDVESAVVIMRQMKEMGFKLAIDDFGTGYSSLSYLKRFPIDRLKIDQSFIRDINTDPDDAAITLAVISMAHSLGLKVIAEGVETAEQLAFLKEHGCDEIQGYYFGKSLPSDEFEMFLRQQELHASKISPGDIEGAWL
ncbi:MAG: EAL domain-containing protein [Deltaproteobacteria bacterium]